MNFLIVFSKWCVRIVCTCVHTAFWLLYEFTETSSSVSALRMTLNIVVNYLYFAIFENNNKH